MVSSKLSPTLLFDFESTVCSTLEKSLHNHFSFYKIRNEWFNDNLPIKKVKEFCYILDKQIVSLKKQNNIFI